MEEWLTKFLGALEQEFIEVSVILDPNLSRVRWMLIGGDCALISLC